MFFFQQAVTTFACVLVEDTIRDMNVILSLQLFITRTILELFNVSSRKSLQVPIFHQLVLPNKKFSRISRSFQIEITKVKRYYGCNNKYCISNRQHNSWPVHKLVGEPELLWLFRQLLELHLIAYMYRLLRSRVIPFWINLNVDRGSPLNFVHFIRDKEWFNGSFSL